METVWNTTSEGVQYFVRLDRDTGRLEYTRDPVSELVGGGYSEMIDAASFEKKDFRMHILKLFGIDALEEMQATARTMGSLPATGSGNMKELEHERNMKYYHELLEIRSHRPRGSSGPGDS